MQYVPLRYCVKRGTCGVHNQARLMPAAAGTSPSVEDERYLFEIIVVGQLLNRHFIHAGKDMMGSKSCICVSTTNPPITCKSGPCIVLFLLAESDVWLEC